MQQQEHPTTRALLGDVVKQSTELVKKELELARVELKEDVRREVAMLKGIAVAALCGLAAFGLLLAAAVFGLGLIVPMWAAALIVAGGVAVIGAIAFAIGWTRRARSLLSTTRTTLKEDVRWAKQVRSAES